MAMQNLVDEVSVTLIDVVPWAFETLGKRKERGLARFYAEWIEHALNLRVETRIPCYLIGVENPRLNFKNNAEVVVPTEVDYALLWTRHCALAGNNDSAGVAALQAAKTELWIWGGSAGGAK